MKIHNALFATFVLLFLLCASIQSYTVVTKSKRCKRKISLNRAPPSNTRAVDFSSMSVCKDQEKQSKNINRIHFKVSSPTVSSKIPAFMVRGFDHTMSKIESEENTRSSFFAQFGFNKIVEYENKNGEPGFQQNTTDVVVREVKLRDLQFSTMSISTEIINGTTIYSLQFDSTTKNDIFSKITFGVTVTSDEVISTMNPSGKRRTVITPNTMKMDLLIEGVEYKNTNTRIAIGSILVSRTKLIQKPKVESTESDEGERPEEPTSDQGVLNMSESGDATGTFSFKKYVQVSNASNAGTQSLDMSSSVVVMDGDEDFEGGKVQVGTNKQITQMWFSVEGQESTLFWDPALGQAEASSAMSFNKVSSIGLVLSIIACVFFAL